MREIVILFIAAGLWGCATTQTVSEDHSSVIDFTYAVAYTDRIWTNRPLRSPKRSSSSNISTIQFISDVYGERILERLNEFCNAKGLFASNRIRSVYGSTEPEDFIEGLRKIGGHARIRPVIRNQNEPPQSVGGTLKTVSCTREAVSPSSPSWHEVEWFAFAIPKPYYSETGSNWTTRYEFLVAERKSKELAPFLGELVVLLQTY